MGPGSFLYNALLVLHIVAIVTAFGPTLAYAALNRAAQSEPSGAGAIARIPVRLQSVLALPALVLAALLGVALVLVSNNRWDFAQTWVSASFTVVLLLVVLSWFVIAPGLKRQYMLLSTGPADADALRAARVSVAMATGFLHLGLVVLIVLMVWKPGA